MAGHVLYGKQELCYTEITDFTQFQGIGGDPLYKRFDSVYAVVEKNIPQVYRDFFAHPVYSSTTGQIKWYVKVWKETPCAYKDLPVSEKEKYKIIKEETIAAYEKVRMNLSGEDKLILTGAIKFLYEDFMFCYDDKVVTVAWGMNPDSNKYIVKGTVLHNIKIQNYHKVYFIPGDNGILSDKLAGTMKRMDGTTLSYLDVPDIIPQKGYTFKGWDPNPLGVKVTKDLTFHALYEEVSVEPETIQVSFVCGEGGVLKGQTTFTIDKGTCLFAASLPSVESDEGYTFVGWNGPTDEPLNVDTVFQAILKRKELHCKFDAGEHGVLEEPNTFSLPYGTIFSKLLIPKAKKGYKFTGWDKSPIDYVLYEDTVFTAQYEEILPWYKRWWMWITGNGCLKWLLWLLLLILFLLFCLSLLRSCDRYVDSDGSSKLILFPDSVTSIGTIETPSGSTIEDNGNMASESSIVGVDGTLPNNSQQIVSPIIGEDGQKPPIIQNPTMPGAPDIVENRLNIYFEDASVNLEQFIIDLQQVYPEKQCEVIGVDMYVPMIQILVPENQRDAIRESLNNRLPTYQFFVVDESIFTHIGNRSTDTLNIGWHLKAVDVEDGWKISKGDTGIVVAVVDDGIDATHTLLKGRIVKPYNVFRGDNKLSIGEGHGTHVAGLAVGSDEWFDKGLSGIAPKCRLMPVQVFDNGLCTFSSVTSGIMYAIHQGAHVVNVSIGVQFSGLDAFPVSVQETIAQTQFKNEEKVWERIIQVANEHNVILVFAVGNDHILASIPPENRRIDATVNVAAVDRQIEGTDFTNYAQGSNISAPGMGIASAVPGNRYAFYDGTSMAAPIVSGTIALMKSCKHDVTVSEVLRILQATGREVSNIIPPMVQVGAALTALTTGNIPAKSSSFDSSQPNNKDNIDGIRKLIEFYKQQIHELEKLLPENKNK